MCLQFDPPRVSDLALLDSVCLDLKNHSRQHINRSSKVENASDIECLADSIEMIYAVIDYFDEWRIVRGRGRKDASPLSRSDLNTLFEIRAVIRSLIIELYK